MIASPDDDDIYFKSFLTVFQSYQDNGRAICVRVCAVFTSEISLWSTVAYNLFSDKAKLHQKDGHHSRKNTFKHISEKEHYVNKILY